MTDLNIKTVDAVTAAKLAKGYKLDSATMRTAAQRCEDEAAWWAQRMGAADLGVAECKRDAERYTTRAKRYDAKAAAYAEMAAA